MTTRTNDRQYWTQSRPTAANGSYASFLVAADQEGDDPVPMQVGIAVGNTAYAEPAADQINFAKLQERHAQRAASGHARRRARGQVVAQPAGVPGAIYQGLLVGVVGGKGGVIKPVSATWPDGNGRFQLVLPSSARGQTVSFWQAQQAVLLDRGREARRGGRPQRSIRSRFPTTPRRVSRPSSCPTDPSQARSVARSGPRAVACDADQGTRLV